MNHSSIFITYFFILAFIFTGCKKPEQYKYHEDNGKIFATSYTIKYEFNRSLKNEIDKKLNEFDNSLNPFKLSSIISKVNNNEEVTLDTFFINVVNRSLEISEKSEGLFDITLSPLINAWGFGFKNSNLITDNQIDSLKEFVGYDKIRIENQKIIKTDLRTNINTSAIAKGYAVDVIAHLLDSYSIENYMVEIGGEIRTKGVSRVNRCWRIEITKPMQKDDFQYTQERTQAILSLCNKALATSGDYYKYYIRDGKKYAHTIDPRTARPSENSILSASVIANDCMSADAFATVFMLADTAKIREIARSEDLDYMLILSVGESKFQVIESENFHTYIVDK